MNKPSRNTAYAPMLLVALLSGSSCLIYELVWSRYLHLIFGISVYAIATVLACFMLGLALGAWHLGRVLDRSRNPARLLMVIQIAIAGYIAAAPLFYRMFSHLTVAMVQNVESDGFLRLLIQFLLAMAALIIPTWLMGGTLPAMIKLVTREHEQVGRRAGMIYAINTLGGALGAFLCGFVLIRSVGLNVSLMIAAGLYALCAVVVGIFVKNQGDKPQAVSEALVKTRGASPVPVARPKPSWLVLGIFGMSGFTALAYEVYWTRLLTMFFRDTIYDFTIVLTAFLCGLVAGSLLGGWLVRGRRNLTSAFGAVEIYIGLSALLGLMLVAQFPYWINDLQTNASMVNEYGANFWLAGRMIRFGYAFALMIVPTTLFGATFPIVSAITVEQMPQLARRIGLLSGINTAGAAAGSVMAGFVLISLLGVQNAVILTALLNIALGMLLLRGWSLPLAAAMAGLVLAAAVPGWDKLRMSVAMLAPNQPLEKILVQHYYNEDATGMTSVVEITPLQRSFLITNRLYSQNNSAMMGLEDHRRLGMIPLLLTHEPQSALVVGLGAGITLRGAADTSVRSIDCVELSPGVIEAARYFSNENADIVHNPKVRLIVNDGRNFISTAGKTYDAIILDIFHPMSSGSSTVFSREYYELCRNRLTDDGLVCQWLPTHQLSMDQIKTIVATFQSVFPHTTLWYGMIGDSTAVIGCIGTIKPLAIDYANLTQTYQDPLLLKELKEVNLGNSYLLLSHFIMGEDTTRRFTAGQRIDTDDRPVIEFAAPMIATQSAQLGIMNQLQISRLTEPIGPYVSNMPDPAELEKGIKTKRTIIDGLELQLKNDSAARLWLYQQALRDDPTNPDLIWSIRQLASPQ